MIGEGDRYKDCLDMIEHPGTTEREVEVGAGVEDDCSTVWIGCARGFVSHPRSK
jgi:hypothetical protein